MKCVLLLADKFVFLTDKSWYLDQSTSRCDLVMIDEEFFPTSYAWAFPNNSQLDEIVSRKYIMQIPYYTVKKCWNVICCLWTSSSL